jgi:uncharacterized repeat protein (TIGR01451 family)
MKKVVLFFIFMCAVAAQNVQAQYVTIPDVNFRNALKVQYPSCFNAANQLDTVCAGNAADTLLNVFNQQIMDLSGIKYFKKLKNFDCSYNPFTVLPKLPEGLTKLVCGSEQLVSITSLPSGLKDFYCTGTSLIGLPALPTGLKIFSCTGTSFTSLPALPNSLLYVYCTENQLTSLPVLPTGLKVLECFSNKITNLPALPISMTYLNCGNNMLTSLPALPNGLKGLDCYENQLSSLPALPAGLVGLNCYLNQITSLAPLPLGLTELYCTHNQLTSLPNLPTGIKYLHCEDNQLSNLPTLPDSLRELVCNDNYQLSCLPLLPKGLYSVILYSTQITCLPNKPIGIANNPFLPPLCNPINDVSDCEIYPTVSGYVFNDANNNGIKDAGETPRAGVKIHIPNKGFFGYSNEYGFYEVEVDSLKTYTASIAQVPAYYTSVIPSQSVTFTQYGQTVLRNFPLVSQGLIKDFKVSVNNFTAFARPGFPLHFRIKYENVGTVAGNATVKFAHVALYSIDSTSIAHSFSGDTLVWNFSNVPAGFTGYINVYGRLSATAVLGSTQNFYASVNQNDVADNVLADNRSNLALEVRGSYDPNDKQGTRTLTPTQVVNGEFIDYTVRFQNTGTDTAFTVVIADTLANNLEANTLEMISASHNARTSLKGNIIYFEFLNILLPDSNVNEPRSHGFVKFRVKPKNNLVLGNEIKNKAAIYFDYNAPVITNTVTTTIAIPTGISEKITNRLEVYPNPLEGEMLSVPNMRGASAKLLTLTGQELRSWTNIGEQISLQNVAAGMYLLEVSQNGQRRTAKVIVK